MNICKKFYCRVYQFAFHAALPFLPYREPKILKNTEAISLEIDLMNIRSVLLITDEFLRSSGLTASLESCLEKHDIKCVVYDKTRPNPTVENVEEALALYHANDCGALVAFGGGSAMDCAKAVGARIVYPKRSINSLRGNLKIFRRLPPLFAVPTTAGTGSEVTLTAVITDSAKKHKYTLNSFPLIPRYAVLDPGVTYSLPKGLTATTGMDALTHAVEAFIGRSTSKETRRLSKEAVELIFQNIETAYADPYDEVARRNMLTAAYKAGIAFSKSYVGYIHAVAHSLGGQYNVPHGLANSVIMPVVLRMYGSHVYRSLKDLAVCAHIADANDTPEMAAEKFISAIENLNMRMEIPKTISGILESDIPIMARHADKEANPLYPVPKLMNAAELEEIYRKVADRR